MDVGLVTCAALPGLNQDDRLLLGGLRERGLTAEPVVWEDRYVDWSAAPLWVVRSCWDYAFRRDAFVAWAAAAGAQSELWNSAWLVEWNTHKRYLCDLADRGVPVVPTVVLPAGTRVDLSAVLAERGWEDAIIKAAVAQSGRYAKRVNGGSVMQGQVHLDRLLPDEDMLVQPYVPSIAEHGELSMVFIEQEFTHAVRKLAAAGDFRVHDDHGGSVAPATPGPAELAAARRALDAVSEPLHYARVDLVVDHLGQPMVMEVEVVEPELFFRYSPVAVARLSEAIERRLRG